MRPGRIFIILILFFVSILGVLFIQQKEHEKWFSAVAHYGESEKAATPEPRPLPPDVLKNYLPVVTIGYGFGAHASGAQKTGIVIETIDGQKSLIPISPDDVLLLTSLDKFLKHINVRPDFHTFATHIIHKADLLKNTQYVLFDINKTCQARFHQANESTCATARDAAAICMVLVHMHLPSLFANKELFSKEYWESLFFIQT